MSDNTNLLKVKDYGQFLDHIKKDIQQSQIKAAIAVNQELILLYWRIGKGLTEKIDNEGWGSKIITTLASDLARLFPSLSGFSARNLVYMRKFAESYPDLNYAAAAAQIPWGHNMVIMDKVEHSDKQLWYVQKCLENGWGRSVLTMLAPKILFFL
jgi:predicted nuclease of restriction endonuclease-like (RecB) superfamily